MEMAVITPPWYSLQEANIVSFLTELEVRVRGRGPTYQLCPLEKTKQSAHESLLSMCLCTFFWALQPWNPPARIQGHRCWLCWTPRAASFSWAIGHAALHFMAGLFLDWERRQGDGLLPATRTFCISTAWWSHQLSSAGIISNEPLPQLSDVNRAAQASQICLCLCCPCRHPSRHPVTCWDPLPGFSLLTSQDSDCKRYRESGRRQAMLPWRHGLYETYSGVILEDTKGRRKGQQELTLLWASILPQWMSVCEHLWWQFINTSN